MVNCVKIIKIRPKQYFVYGKGLGSFYAKKNSILDKSFNPDVSTPPDKSIKFAKFDWFHLS